MSNECLRCGYANEDNEKFCINCGAKLMEADSSVPDDRISCYFCGYKNPEDSRFCIRCGTRIHHELPYENELTEIYTRYSDVVDFNKVSYNIYYKYNMPQDCFLLNSELNIYGRYPEEYDMECPFCHKNSFSVIDSDISIGSVKITEFHEDEYHCSSCGLEIKVCKKDDKKIPGRRYLIANMDNREHWIWKKYGNTPLYKYELDEIFNGGLSDDDKARLLAIHADYHRKAIKLVNRFSIYVSVRFAAEILSEEENSLKPIDTTFFLDDDEEAYFIFTDIDYSKPMVRYSTFGQSQGSYDAVTYGQSFDNAFSYLNGRSFYADTMGYFSTSTYSSTVSYEKVKVVDRGILLLTNKRLIFSGSIHSLDIDIDKILNLVHDRQSLMIHVKGRSNIVKFSNLDSNEFYLNLDGRQLSLNFTGYLLRTLIVKFMSPKKKRNLLKSKESL